MITLACVCIVIGLLMFAACTYQAPHVDWEVRLQCPCGWHTEAKSGDSSHIMVGCCPECGRRKPATAGKTGDWELRVMKWTDGAWETQG